MRYDILIIFDDYTRTVINDASDYGINEMDCFYFVKNGVRSFLPKEHVVFFGKASDWGIEDYY